MRPDKNCKSAWLPQDDGGGDGRMCRVKPNVLKVINRERVSPLPAGYPVRVGGGHTWWRKLRVPVAEFICQKNE